jgi:hypothetical protein
MISAATHASPPARANRLVAVLGVLCVLHAADLVLTQHYADCVHFLEANVVAAQVVHSPLALTLYKVIMFGSGVSILYLARKHRQAEVGAYFLLAVSIGLMLWWGVYLTARRVVLDDPQLIATLF